MKEMFSKILSSDLNKIIYFDVLSFMAEWKQSRVVYSAFITGVIVKFFEKIDKVMLVWSILTYKKYYV